jgi:predicted nucleotidyltransferase
MTAARPDGSSAALSREEALALADALARASSRALGDALAAMILHGSLTQGDYLPGRSDIDLLAVVNAPITDTQRAALARAIGHERPRAAIRVDLRVVTREAAGAPTPRPPMEAHLTIRRPQPRLGIDGHHPGERDLVVELSVCRAHGRSLLGAPPSELIGDVPDAWVLEVGDAQLADWQAIGDDPPYAQLTVLTACRIWRFAEERCHSSKDAAGHWALRRDPTLTVVRDALHQRRSDPTHPIDATQVHDLLTVVRDRLELSGTRIARARGVDDCPASR